MTAVELNGDDGFATACSNEFDVIVLDIMLPGKHGYDIVRDLRAREIWTPILMLSAKDGEYDLADAFDLGADDYLVKPFSFVVLLARLRALVRRGAPQRPAILSVGDLSLDPAKHQVSRGGNRIDPDAKGVQRSRILDAQQWCGGHEDRDRSLCLGHQLRR